MQLCIVIFRARNAIWPRGRLRLYCGYFLQGKFVVVHTFSSRFWCRYLLINLSKWFTLANETLIIFCIIFLQKRVAVKNVSLRTYSCVKKWLVHPPAFLVCVFMQSCAILIILTDLRLLYWSNTTNWRCKIALLATEVCISVLIMIQVVFSFITLSLGALRWLLASFWCGSSKQTINTISDYLDIYI